VLVPEPGHTLDLDKVREFAKQHLSTYKVPRVLLVIEAADLPMMSSGKVNRLALIAELEKQHAVQS
jgi:acyl-CoA synthetase (AMP-forming)/AMP-acid ligase II